MNREQKEAAFKMSVERSIYSTLKTAEILLKKGFDIEIPSHVYKLNNPEIDKGDLYAIKNGKRFKVEVKHWLDTKAASFTCLNDLYPKLIVNDEAKVEKNLAAQTLPDYYITWNKELTHYFIIAIDTFKSWYVEKQFDSRMRRDAFFYFINRDKLTVVAAS